jgi:hypothetical protein
MRFNAHTASFKINRNHDLLISLFIMATQLFVIFCNANGEEVLQWTRGSFTGVGTYVFVHN